MRKELEMEGFASYRCFENPECPIILFDRFHGEGLVRESIPEIRAICEKMDMEVVDQNLLPSYRNEVGEVVRPEVPGSLRAIILGEIVIADCTQLNPNSPTNVCGSIIAISKDRFQATGPIRDTLDSLYDLWQSRKVHPTSL